MPVTAKLSQKFYERLGEDVTNELVDWFNAVDATYRNDLRELNERNFERFDDRVGRRFAEFRADIDRRFAALDADVDRRFAEFRADVERRFAEADVRAERRLAGLERRVLRWMFGFWVATLVPLAGLMWG